MLKRGKIIVLVIIVIVLVMAGFLAWSLDKKYITANDWRWFLDRGKITTFEECEKAVPQIRIVSPSVRECSTPSIFFGLIKGKTFRKIVIPPLTNETPTNWQFIDAGSFTLSLPPNWKFNKLQGIDSYVGEFVGNDAKLHFDFGWYSNSLAEDSDPNHIVTYETIDRYRAKIVVPKVTGNGITGVYFDKLGGGEPQLTTKLNLYGENFTSSQQETALKIFRTLKIVKQTWP